MSKAYTLLRASAIVFPTALLGLVWLDNLPRILLAVVIAFLLNFFLLSRHQVKRSWLYTFLLCLLLCLGLAGHDAFASMPTIPVNSAYIAMLFTRIWNYTLISLPFAFPGWLLFWALDHTIRSKNLKKP